MPDNPKDLSSDEYPLMENKLLLLYLIDKIDIPLSNSQISEFALNENYMNYFFLQQCLGEMADDDYLEATHENNTTRYTITDGGLQALEFFEKQIPVIIKEKINTYVVENRRRLKRDYEVTANYFFEHETQEYVVKCGIYEESTVLMEINVSVVSREQAKIIVNNWKENVSSLYSDILGRLVKESTNILD